MQIRPATTDDLPKITELYNHYIETSHATFDTAPFSVTQRRPWFENFDNKRHLCLVAMAEDTFKGFATSTAFKPKAAYSTSVEVSVYATQSGQGVGRALYHHLFPLLLRAGVHRAYAGVTLPNLASIRLHQAFGFRQAAKFSEVGYKFDTYWDVIWLEKDCEPA